MARNTEVVNNGKVNAIVEGTVIEGSIKSDGNFRIDGKVIGTIDIKGRLIIGAKGTVDGTVSCNDADIEGTFNGDIKISNLLSLKSSSKISGDAIFQRLKVEEGAQLACTCNIKSSSSSVSVQASAKEFVKEAVGA
ncbi:MAG: polymer-forming cytoskeletal protein [Bacteroidota bacterium]